MWKLTNDVFIKGKLETVKGGMERSYARSYKKNQIEGGCHTTSNKDWRRHQQSVNLEVSVDGEYCPKNWRQMDEGKCMSGIQESETKRKADGTQRHLSSEWIRKIMHKVNILLNNYRSQWLQEATSPTNKTDWLRFCWLWLWFYMQEPFFNFSNKNRFRNTKTSLRVARQLLSLFNIDNRFSVFVFVPNK